MKKRVVFILVFIVSIVLLYGIFSLVLFETSAKYTNYNEMNHYYKSNDLYISSDVLSLFSDKYKIINYYNYEDIELEIYNYIDDTKITSYDIEYKLECKVLGDASNYYDCAIDDGGNILEHSIISEGFCVEDNFLSLDECMMSNYNYELNKVKEIHKTKLIKKSNNNYNKIEMEIVLNTTSPFKKELKAIYILNMLDKVHGKIDIEVLDYNYFCKYILENNYDVNKLVKLRIDTDKLVYNKDDNVFLSDNVEYITDQNDLLNSIKFNMGAFSKQEIIINKNDFDNDCLKSDIVLNILE